MSSIGMILVMNKGYTVLGQDSCNLDIGQSVYSLFMVLRLYTLSYTCNMRNLYIRHTSITISCPKHTWLLPGSLERICLGPTDIVLVLDAMV